ncbi:ABC transporter ATP-binding protein (plasmid) [Rhizobium leguminosarum]|nr:ABC transporter ATP-binding protein [Rhizobium leguminosarum]
MTLKYENVTYTYASSDIGVFDISLEIGRGELLAIIGASGSGKSTILKLLAGFVTPATGRVLVDGKDVSNLPPRSAAARCCVPELRVVPSHAPLGKRRISAEGKGVSKAERRTRAIEMLGRVGMGSRSETLPTMLSGGQQQRVALARALVFDPRGLLLDEPLSALDASLRVEMRDEILRVQRASGIATLLVTHDQEEALSIADKVAVMRDGRLIQVGTPRELYETPVDAYVAAFVGQSNLWPGKIASEGFVETPFGSLACETKGKSAGDSVTVFVRPERVTPLLGATAASRPGQFAGTVSADRFLGPVRRIDLDVSGGLIRLETHLREPIESVAIPPEAVRLLPAV